MTQVEQLAAFVVKKELYSYALHTILKHGSTSLRKPEARKRLRSKMHQGDPSYGYSEQRSGGGKGTLQGERHQHHPQAVARAIELSTTRYCPVIGLLGKVAEVATRYEIE
ncbi:MAG: hypothetical protein ACJ8CB_19420 [Ktedonobacteraceae bacterium]